MAGAKKKTKKKSSGSKKTTTTTKKRASTKIAAKRSSAPAKKKTTGAAKKKAAAKTIAPKKKKIAAPKKKTTKKTAARKKKTTAAEVYVPIPETPRTELLLPDDPEDGDGSSPSPSDRIPETKPEAGAGDAVASAPLSSRSILPPSPSQSMLPAHGVEAPIERPLNDEEREAMVKVARAARMFLGIPDDASPAEVVHAIAELVEEVRSGAREEPKSQDVKLGLGVLWGEQLREQVGWVWVHLAYSDGFASYALVPDDRAFACFPLNRIPEAMQHVAANSSGSVFHLIVEDTLPPRARATYVVVG